MACPARARARRVTSLPRHRTLSSTPQTASRTVQPASSAETRMFMRNYSSSRGPSRIPRSGSITPVTGVMQLDGGLLGLLGLGGLRLVEDELAVRDVDPDGVALGKFALEQPQRELVDELLLDHPLQRAGAIGRVEAEVAELLSCLLGELDLDAPLADPARQGIDLDLDDLAEVVLGEAVEDDHVVDPVQELGREGLGEGLLDLLPRRLLHGLGRDELRADVRGHDQ